MTSEARTHTLGLPVQGCVVISFGRHISILHKRKVQMPIEGFFKTANTFDDWEPWQPSKGDLSLSFCVC